MLDLIRERLGAKGINPAHILKFNFEDMEFAPLCSAGALYAYLKEKLAAIPGKAYLFFDEIQEVTEWERCVNSLRVAFNTDIYLTGSNAALLSGELASILAGRYVEIAVYPFSFTEFLELYRLAEPEATLASAFTQYTLLGGMPFLHNLEFRPEASALYLRDVYNSVVLKDIVKRGGIRDVDMLERLLLYIMSNMGQPFSATSLSKFFKSEGRTVSPETILNYLKTCENAFLFHRAKRQELKGKQVLTINEKFYTADHGLCQAVQGERPMDINLVLENMVYMELRRRGYHITVGKLGEREIDFVGERQKELIYIQTAYLLASPETVEREFGPLGKIRDSYPKYVLSLDEFDFSRDGIIHRNIRDWLLGG
jgi:predicted AAA+ superfamily ATPase